jgi:plasmid stabilization system protein ParE
MARLTKRVVDAAEAGSAAVFIWDDEIKGFGLRIAPGGTKSYVLNYRAGHGRKALQRRITIGKHGSPWTPEQARQEARRLLGTVAAGDDPAAAQGRSAHHDARRALRSLSVGRRRSQKTFHAEI